MLFICQDTFFLLNNVLNLKKKIMILKGYFHSINIPFMFYFHQAPLGAHRVGGNRAQGQLTTGLKGE